MKNSIVLFILMSICSLGFSQVYQVSELISIDTIKGADTINFRTPLIKKTIYMASLQVNVEQISTSPTGYMVAQASNDGDGYTNLISTDNLIYGFPNDTVSTSSTNGMWNIFMSNNYYGVKVINAVNDTIVVEASYLLKIF